MLNTSCGEVRERRQAASESDKTSSQAYRPTTLSPLFFVTNGSSMGSVRAPGSVGIAVRAMIALAIVGVLGFTAHRFYKK